MPSPEWTWFRPYLGRETRRLSVGIAMVCITNAFQLSLPYLSKQAIDALQGLHSHQARQFAYIIAGVAVAQAVIRVFSRLYLLDAGRQVEFRIRGDLFGHLTELTPSFFGRLGVGDVMSRCVNDLGQLRMLVGPGLLILINTVAGYTVALPAMLKLDPLLTVCALGPYLPLLFLLQEQVKRVFVRMRAVQDQLGVLSARLQENLAGQLSVKSFGRERSESAAFAAQNEAYLQANLGLARARATMSTLFGAIGGLGAVVVLGLGGLAVMHGRLTLGGYAAFSGYLAELSMRASMLGFFLAGFQRGRAALARVREVALVAPEFSDPSPATTAVERPLTGRLAVQGLSVVYGARKVLDGVSFEVAPGRSLAVVGRTGSGKSTLLAALARLVEVPEGSVRYDGVDVRAWPLRALRSQIGLVPQEPFLFSATLADNIAFGRPGAPREAIVAAADAARLSPDLRALPEGLETEVGERGVTLSGGQRSRSALARALLIQPRVLLMDDPFANVDADTARALWEELERHETAGVPGGATRVLVTHRLSLAMACDEIAVLEDGKLVERGHHQELLARAGAYARLFAEEQIAEELQQELQGDHHAMAPKPELEEVG